MAIIMNGISKIEGYDSLAPDIKSLIVHVITNFLNKKISSKVASKRISALFETEELVNEVNTVLQAYSYQMPLQQYKDKYQNHLPRKSGNWTPSEDAKLIEAVTKLGTNNWGAIAEYVGNGRTKSQCSQRWDRTLDPTISRDEWTTEETKKLIAAVKKYGTKSWVKVSKEIGTRSDVQCRYRYNNTVIGHNKSDTYRGSVKPRIRQSISTTTSTTEDSDKGDKKDRFSFLDKLEFTEDIISNITF